MKAKAKRFREVTPCANSSHQWRSHTLAAHERTTNMHHASSRASRLVPAILGLTLLLTTPGASRADDESEHQPIILRADADVGAGILFVHGVDFGATRPPVVTLGGVRLAVQSYSPTDVVATLDPGLAAGSYPLHVGTYSHRHHDGQPERWASLDVTLGAQGPKGDQGVPGSQGLPGPTGPQGVTGPTGEPGLQGQKGDTGDTGPQGPTGQKGDKGDPGSGGGTLLVTTVVSGPVGLCGTWDPTSCSAAGGAVATCPAGTVVVGGGYQSGRGQSLAVFIGQNGPSSQNGWAVSASNTDPIFGWEFYAVAQCLSVGP
jgi:hypothetical protein